LTCQAKAIATEAGAEVNADEKTIIADATMKKGGPPRGRYWNVRIATLNGTSGVLEDGLKVTS